jgi:hypothetical protein
VSIDPEREFKKLINDLVTECTRCKCEIRVGDLLNNAPAPCLFEVPTFAKGERPLAGSRLADLKFFCGPSALLSSSLKPGTLDNSFGLYNLAQRRSSNPARLYP